MQTSKGNESCHCSKSGGFGSGLLVGVLVGVGLFFLLGTKRGRKILQAISEKGIEDFADLTDIIQNTDFEEEEFPEDGEVVATPKKEGKSVSSAIRPLKRFFRGVKK